MTTLTPICTPRTPLLCRSGPRSIAISGSLTRMQVVDIALIPVPDTSAVDVRARAPNETSHTVIGAAQRSRGYIGLHALWRMVLPCLAILLFGIAWQVKLQQTEMHGNMLALIEAQATQMQQLYQHLQVPDSSLDSLPRPPVHQPTANVKAARTFSLAPVGTPPLQEEPLPKSPASHTPAAAGASVSELVTISPSREPTARLPAIRYQVSTFA